MGLRRERKPKGHDTEACVYCRTPLLVNGYRDAVKDHCHITGKYQPKARHKA